MSERAWVKGAEWVRQGTELTADAPAGTTVLQVDWAGEFDDAEGESPVAMMLELNGVALEYVDSDEDADTITLAAPLAVAAVEGDGVYVMQGGVVQVDYVLSFTQGEDGEDGDVLVPFEQRPLWPEGDYDEWVEVLLSDDLERIEAVPGRTPVIDGSLIDPDTLPVGSPGQTFSTDAPTVTDGFAENHAWWQVIDGEVVGFWRLTAGVWTPAEIVTSAAIESLSTINLSAVNFESVNIDGGSIAIAVDSTGSYPQGFSGTSLPAGWTTTLTNSVGTGSPDAGAGSAGASVVNSGAPSGAVGSTLKIDYGPARTGAAFGGSVFTDLSSGAAEAEVRFRHNLATAPFSPPHLRLAVRHAGPAHTNTEDYLGIVLDYQPYDPVVGGRRHFIRSVINGSMSTLGHVDCLGTDAATNPTLAWQRAKFRVTAGVVQAKVWPDGTAEPEWKTIQSASVTTPGGIGLLYKEFDSTGTSSGQVSWVDEFNVDTFSVGFQVNPDGTGDWPALRASLGAYGKSSYTVDASGDVTIAHNLGVVPTYVNIFPSATAGRGFYVEVPGSKTTTDVKIRCYTPANALQASGTVLNLNWEAKP